jgi:chemotaxis-related protein WspD
MGNLSCPKLEEFLHCRHCPVYADAASHLLDRPISPESLAEWTERIKAPRLQVKKVGNPLLIFRIGLEWLAIPPNDFQEVALKVKNHSLPARDPSFVKGIANIRGELIPLISLARLLGIPREDSPQQELPIVLVLLQNQQRVAFDVDETFRIETIDLESAMLPVTLDHATNRYTKAVVPLGEKSVGILDLDLLNYTLSRNFA